MNAAQRIAIRHHVEAARVFRRTIRQLERVFPETKDITFDESGWYLCQQLDQNEFYTEGELKELITQLYQDNGLKLP